MLEFAADSVNNVTVSEKLLQETSVNMEVEWLTLQTGNHGESTTDRILLTEMEVSWCITLLKHNNLNTILPYHNILPYYKSKLSAW